MNHAQSGRRRLTARTVAAVACAAALATALLLGWPTTPAAPAPAWPPRLDMPSLERPAAEPALARRAGPEGGGWRVVREVAVNRVAVLHVEVSDLAVSGALAELLAEPYQGSYSEVLVYFAAPGAGRASPLLRVQWTRTGGFRELWLVR